MRIYLSGKITGDRNFKEKFDGMEKRLKALGYDVFNPTIFPQYFEYEEFMAFDFMALGFSDIIFLQNCWERSSGAKREYEEALRLGKKIMTPKDIVLREALLKVCQDTEDLADDVEKEGYDPYFVALSKKQVAMVREAVKAFDDDLTEEENLFLWVSSLKGEEQELIMKEFLKDAEEMILADFETDSTDWKRREEYRDYIFHLRKAYAYVEERLNEEKQMLKETA